MTRSSERLAKRSVWVIGVTLVTMYEQEPPVYIYPCPNVKATLERGRFKIFQGFSILSRVAVGIHECSAKYGARYGVVGGSSPGAALH